VSEEQLTAFLAALKDDAELQEKLKGAADLDAAVAMAQEAGFDVSKADWLRHQAQVSDEDLEDVAGANACNLNGTGCQWKGPGWIDSVCYASLSSELY
jgi:predicted ribosomally synthesized peptide with nif11-like leader